MGDRGRRHPIGDGELAENVGDVQRGRFGYEKRLASDVGQTLAQGQSLTDGRFRSIPFPR
jgi:hypothetical protein